jgi:hypothetical protein
MDRSIKAGVYGFLLSIIINLFSPIYLYFIPSFFAAILVIYIFRLEALKDGLVAAFMTYIFSDGILSTIVLATWYLANKPYPSFNVDIWTMLSPIVSAVTALITGYIGVWLVQKMKPARELPPTSPQPLPPI